MSDSKTQTIEILRKQLAEAEARHAEASYDASWVRRIVQLKSEIAQLEHAPPRMIEPNGCQHESVTTPNGSGAFCRFCGETLA
jgi:hypothetical protein